MLTALPALGLSALEAGMQQFLDQLEQLTPRTFREQGGKGLWLWLAAGAAAAGACELARRQLRRSAGEDNPMPGSSPELHPGGKS
jgi:hypothetical protein